MERAVERRGGEKALEERAEGFHRARREERHADFEDYREGRPTRPRAREESRGDEPAVIAPAPSAPAVATPSPVIGDGAPAGSPPAPLPAGGPAPQGPTAPTALPAPPPSAPVPPGQAPTGAVASSGAPGAAPVSAAVSGADPGAPLASVEGDRARAAATPPATRPASPGPAPEPALIEQAAEVLRQLRAHLSPGLQRVLVHLSPPELGRMAIQVSLRKGRLDAVVRAESPQTLELLERHAPELRAMLAQEGIEAESLELHLGLGGERAGGRDATDAPRADETARREPEPIHPGAEDRREGASLSTREDGIDTYA